MSELIPFQFDGAPVRVQIDDVGVSWFNAGDICSVLEFTNPCQAIESHVDADDVQKLDTLTAGGLQRQNHVNESGLYALILGSTKVAAKRFKCWVTSEVLPALRKTGSYGPSAALAIAGPTDDRVAAILRLGQAIASVPGVRPGIAAAATLACVHTNTGIAIEDLRRALPVASSDEVVCTHNATQLGKLAGVSAKAMNIQLAGAGLQIKNQRDEWELTDAGQKWGEALPYAKGSHAGYQVLWNPAVVDWLRSVA